MNAHRFQSGFTIVEVLVALVVLAVGMLGMAGLYVTTLRSSGSALSRMQAVNLAADMADRIRANRLARVAYQTGTTTPAKQTCVNSGTCTQEQMAENDLFVWQQQIDDVLPGDNQRGEIVYTAATVTAAGPVPDNYVITVHWQETAGGGNQDTDADGDSDLRYVLTMQVDP
ncbi:type IV pilus modification protein PilV [Peristeroidobacter agariperforans]|uniref:type IV pilus modification protein PilV n=1 Tax=Peristeroidobacter agariperforans TaxID=268404 RepID=UPI00101DC0DA|nr:type IV pilus modification protein PilV [Peristeroidobacter agariperforans]